jgi:flavin-dependent dehydrogenase
MRRLVGGLLDDARVAGAELVEGSLAGIEHDGLRSSAVVVEGREGPVRIEARLVVDASGIGGAVRGRVPWLAGACPPPGPEDRCSAAESQYAVRDPGALADLLRAHGAEPGQDLAFPGVAGGFSTLTLFTTPTLDQVGVLTGSIPAVGVPDGGALLERFVARAPWLGERLWGGRGAIPLRRPYEVLGGGGVALVGDAACQVHGAHGSGVGMGLLAARALADAAAGADDPGSDAALAAYERAFHRAHGPLLASADAFRRFVQRASRADVAALIEEGLLDERLAAAALAQRPTVPDLRFALAMAPRALRAPGLSLRFAPLAARSAILDRLGGLAGAPRVGRRLGRALGVLVGASPRAAGTGPWSLPEATAGPR